MIYHDIEKQKSEHNKNEKAITAKVIYYCIVSDYTFHALCFTLSHEIVI
jgi:hypothetical protein